MTTIREQELGSGERPGCTDAVSRLESLLRELADEGLTEIGFTASIAKDGTVEVVAQTLEPASSGASIHLQPCKPAKLPRRALVAFAVRSARRCLPFVLPFASTAEDALVLDAALAHAEKVARGQTDIDAGRFSVVLEQLQTFVVDFPPAGDDPSILAGAHAATATFQAVYAAYEAQGVHESGDGVQDRVQRVLFESSVAAAHAAEASLAPGADAVIAQVPRRLGASSFARAMANDYRLLSALGLGEYPYSGAPLDPSEEGPLGTLWPEGKPDWYREGFERLGWQTVAQVRLEVEASARARTIPLSYSKLAKLAERSTPPQAWFDEGSTSS